MKRNEEKAIFRYFSVTVFCFDLYNFFIKKGKWKKKHKIQNLKKTKQNKHEKEKTRRILKSWPSNLSGAFETVT